MHRERYILAQAAPEVHGVAPQPTIVNCANAYFGYDGYQHYYHVQCSAGPYTTFQSVNLYCPVGTTPVRGWVSYT